MGFAYRDCSQDTAGEEKEGVVGMNSSNQSKEIIIREALLKEAKTIYNVVQIAFDEYRQGKDNPHLEEDLEEIKKDIKNNLVLVIITQNNCIAGTLRLVPEDENKVYLKKFAILPEYQGQGWGSILFSKAENKARDRNYQKIYLHSSTEEEKLVKFYKKLGFECIEVNRDMGYERGLWVKEL